MALADPSTRPAAREPHPTSIKLSRRLLRVFTRRAKASGRSRHTEIIWALERDAGLRAPEPTD